MRVINRWKKYREKECNVYEGWKVYRKIKKMYGNDAAVCISQHPALGDAYLAGLYLNACYGKKKFVVTVLNPGAAEVYRYLKVERICSLSQRETEMLIDFCRFVGMEQCEVRVLHHQALRWHTGILQYMQGVKGLTFADLFEVAVFPGMNRCDRRYPKITDKKKQVFEQAGLAEGNTVLIFPYTNTLYMPELEFWNRLINWLRKKYDCIATYVYGSEKELPRTMPVRGKLEDIAAIAEYAGIVIGMRSGLMDILGRADCRKIILYPRTGAEDWIHGTIKDYWSINRFGYCHDAEEYEYESLKMEEIEW